MSGFDIFCLQKISLDPLYYSVMIVLYDLLPVEGHPITYICKTLLQVEKVLSCLIIYTTADYIFHVK